MRAVNSEYDVTSYTGKDGLVHTVVMDTGSAGEGTDDLVRIQRLQFADWTYALNGSTLTALWRTLNNADAAPPPPITIFPHNLVANGMGMTLPPPAGPLPVAAGGGAASTSGSLSLAPLVQMTASFGADTGVVNEYSEAGPNRFDDAGFLAAGAQALRQAGTM